MDDVLALLMAGIVGTDLIMAHLIGVCPAIAISRKLETATGFAISNMVVAPLAAVLSYSVLHFGGGASLHVPLTIPIVIASVLVCLYVVANIGERFWPQAHGWLEPFLPLMTVNCTLLGVVLLSAFEHASVIAVAASALGLAAGYGVFLIVFSQIRERLVASAVPAAFRDAPIAILTMAIIAMALSGFTAAT